MAGQKLPIEVVEARGSKHLTKAEIQERREREIKPITDNIIAPAYLTNEMCDDTDGCHPSTKGHKLYARNLAGKLC